MEHLTLKPVYEGKRRGAGSSQKRGFYVGRRIKLIEGFDHNDVRTYKVIDSEQKNGKLMITLYGETHSGVYYCEAERLKQLIFDTKQLLKKNPSR